jgi:hypothetical protein
MFKFWHDAQHNTTIKMLRRVEYSIALREPELLLSIFIGGIKIFRCLSDRFRNHIRLLEDIFIGISAAIWNNIIKFKCLNSATSLVSSHKKRGIGIQTLVCTP